MNDIEIRDTETRTLPVTLTDAEVRERAREAAGLVGQIEEGEEAEAGRRKAVKQSLDGLRARLRDLSEQVRTGEELRSVDVRVEYDYAVGERRVVREDTNEVLIRRALTADERQATLGGAGA